MKRDCSTCTFKEGSCYPSKTIFDKDKTCKSYDPDYEGYITELEKENAELKDYNKKLLQSDIDKQNKIVFLSEKVNALQKVNTDLDEHLTKAKEIIKNLLDCLLDFDEDTISFYKQDLTKAEVFLKE